jgi:hypothetical protein
MTRISERFFAGDTVDALAADYEVDRAEVEQAIRAAHDEAERLATRNQSTLDAVEGHVHALVALVTRTAQEEACQTKPSHGSPSAPASSTAERDAARRALVAYGWAVACEIEAAIADTHWDVRTHKLDKGSAFCMEAALRLLRVQLSDLPAPADYIEEAIRGWRAAIEKATGER